MNFPNYSWKAWVINFCCLSRSPDEENWQSQIRLIYSQCSHTNFSFHLISHFAFCQFDSLPGSSGLFRDSTCLSWFVPSSSSESLLATVRVYTATHTKLWYTRLVLLRQMHWRSLQPVAFVVALTSNRADLHAECTNGQLKSTANLWKKRKVHIVFSLFIYYISLLCMLLGGI